MTRGASALLMLVVPCAACASIAGLDDLAVGESGIGEAPDGRDGDAPRSGDATSPDARADREASPDGATPDTSIPDAAVCTLPSADRFAAASPRWVLRGDAALANPGVLLTPAAGSKGGAVWWDEQWRFDVFEISFGYKITPPPAGVTNGDGLAMAWVGAPAVPALGGLGHLMGVSGLQGWAVVIDTYTNTNFADPPTPALMIKSTQAMDTTLAAAPVNAALVDGKEHVVTVRLEAGSVTVSLDGAVALGPTALPGYAPYEGYFGFGAGTGGAYADHLLTSVTARIGDGACAPP